MRPFVRGIIVASPSLLLFAHACLPYTVGATAKTVPAHETTRSTSWYYIPNAIKVPGDSIAGPLAGSNLEFRHGLDARTDIGLRLMPGGVGADYKRRIDSDQTGTGTAVAYSVGGGIVNGGEHLMLQGTLMASGPEDRQLVPYGGLRAIHVVPITQGAVSDQPTIGLFGGLQIGDADFTIRPELGVFYDHSALGLRRGDVIFVPALTLQRGRRRAPLASDNQRPSAAPTAPSDPRRTPTPIFMPRRP